MIASANLAFGHVGRPSRANVADVDLCTPVDLAVVGKATSARVGYSVAEAAALVGMNAQSLRRKIRLEPHTVGHTRVGSTILVGAHWIEAIRRGESWPRVSTTEATR